MTDDLAAVQQRDGQNTINGLFLSEATRLNDFQKGKLNLIFSDVGSGKTQYVGQKLINELDYEGAYIFLSPYKSLKEQVIAEHSFENSSSQIVDALMGFIEFEDNENFENFDFRGKKIIFTAQKFFWLTKKYPEIWSQIGVLIIDEIDHVLYTLPVWSKNPNDPFRNLTETIIKNMFSTYIIGLTATNIDKLTMLWENNSNIIQFAEPLRKLTPQSETEFTQLYPTINNILISIKGKSKLAIFTKLVNSAVQIKQHLLDQGYTVDLIVADNAKNYTMTPREQQLKSDIELSGISNFGDVLIFNSTLERGVSILDTSFSHVVINDSNPTVQAQVLGRFRFDGIQAYYLQAKIGTTVSQTPQLNNNSITVPEQYLGIPLYSTDIDSLVNLIRLTDNRGRLLKWTTLSKKLIDMGYTVSSSIVKTKGVKSTVYTIKLE